jgi:4-amino-4-deoxy-L-arabinose transferase-like glycosyltransferase
VARPFVLAWSVAFILLVISQRGYAGFPAYHDGLLHFDVAWIFREALWFPFVRAVDTGHPPLVSWMLAWTWLLPVDRLVAMHFLAWMAAAGFVAAVFEVSRRTFGLPAAIFVAGLLFLHPVFAAQALQLNLDLFHAAFAWLAILAAVVGRVRLLAALLSLTALCKLNGLFTVAGFAVWALSVPALSRDWRARRVLSAFAPLAVPALVFAGYHALKLALVGHAFATPEFVDDNLRFVASPREHWGRLLHARDQIVGFQNPNLWVLRISFVAIAAAAAAVAVSGVRAVRAAAGDWLLPPSAEKGDAFYRPMSSGTALGLVLAVAAVHVELWSTRSYLSLVRYFVLVYPALYLTLAAVVSLLPPRRRGLALLTIGLPLSALFFVQSKPTLAARWFPGHTRALLFPPSRVQTNYENSLEIVDLFQVLRRTAAHLEHTAPPALRLQAPWPFSVYLSDPRHGLVREARASSSDAPEIIIETSSRHPRKEPSELAPPPGFALDHVERAGRVWMAVFRR